MKSGKSKTVALMLCIFGGYLGLHRFYVGKVKTGLLYLVTVGLCGFGWLIDIALILADKFTDSHNRKLSASSASRDSSRDTSNKNPNNEYYTFKLAGVTFSNGRKSRQAILRKIYWKDEPYDGFIVYTLNQYDFEGESAVGVYANDEQIGNVPRESLPYVLTNWNRIASVYSVNVYGGGKLEDGTNKNFGAEVTICLKNQNSNSSPTNVPAIQRKATSQLPVYVFVSKGGKKHHKDPYCGGMKNSTRILLSDAERKGYTKCEKCCNFIPY